MSHMIQIKLTSEEFKALNEYAIQDGKTVHQYIMSVAKQPLAKKKKKASYSVGIDRASGVSKTVTVKAANDGKRGVQAEQKATRSTDKGSK